MDGSSRNDEKFDKEETSTPSTAATAKIDDNDMEFEEMKRITKMSYVSLREKLKKFEKKIISQNSENTLTKTPTSTPPLSSSSSSSVLYNDPTTSKNSNDGQLFTTKQPCPLKKPAKLKTDKNPLSAKSRKNSSSDNCGKNKGTDNVNEKLKNSTNNQTDGKKVYNSNSMADNQNQEMSTCNYGKKSKNNVNLDRSGNIGSTASTSKSDFYVKTMTFTSTATVQPQNAKIGSLEKLLNLDVNRAGIKNFNKKISKNGTVNGQVRYAQIPKKTLSNDIGFQNKRSVSYSENSNISLPPKVEHQQRSTSLSEFEFDSIENLPQKKSRHNRRRHGKHRGKKNKTSLNGDDDPEINTNQIPIYAKETENLMLNAETFLVMDLLNMPIENHKSFLIDLALTRKILIKDDVTNSYNWNPKIQKLRFIWSNNLAESFMHEQHTSASAEISNLQSNEEKKTKVFEDIVNSIVLENLNEEMIKKFEFPRVPKRSRIRNYYNTPEFEVELENFAQKWVSAGLGEVLEGEIRINQKNNDQAFIKNSNSERDAFLSTGLTRKYALHGDIVRVFIRNSKNFTTVNTNSTIVEKKSSIHDKNSSTSDKNSNTVDKNSNNTKNSISIDEDLNDKIEEHLFPKIELNENNSAGNEKEMSKNTEFENSDIHCKHINNENTIFGVDDSSNMKTTRDEDIDLGITNDEIILEEEQIIPEKACKAFVIKIVKEVHNRRCVGTFLSYRKDCGFITFVPRDMRMNNLRILRENWPKYLQDGHLDNIGDTLYLAEVVSWKNDICIGKILHPVGKCGELESENKAILTQHNLSTELYDEKFNVMYDTPLEITTADLKQRRDIRSECIFTIDPLTAKDLDDAMSCKKLDNGLYEIGVHISDVAYFLQEGSELDELVRTRTTSVYMVNEVFHMLPKPLCFKCSLLPNEDKYALSVFWIMNENAECIETKFSRTVINSCTQFAYEHAQKIIDNPNKKFESYEFPPVHNGFAIDEVVEKIKILHSLAEKMRQKRFNNGALKINRPKLYFDLHPETGEPISFTQASLDTANFMIEEFMLLANQSVAAFIVKKFPNNSILRSHQPPIKNVMQKVKEKLQKYGLILDITSSKTIHDSLTEIISKSGNSKALEIILSNMVSKPMARARYFCSEDVKENDYWHYALSIPIYTHFTSPIRRYPDILVHRLLVAALGYVDPPKITTPELHLISTTCNVKKLTSKLAGEDSSNLYFLHYIKCKKTVKLTAAINEFGSNSMEIILIDTGHTLRVPYPRGTSLGDRKITNDDSVKPRQAKLKRFINTSVEESEILKVFDKITVEVYVEKSTLKARIPICNTIPTVRLANEDKCLIEKGKIDDFLKSCGENESSITNQDSKKNSCSSNGVNEEKGTDEKFTLREM